MNRRQKKKRYKKLYGYNPPKGADGRYMFHVQYGADLAEQYRKPIIEQVEEPPVVVARSLTERRKKCRRKEWIASRK